MITTIEWTATPVPNGVACPFCRGTGRIKTKVKSNSGQFTVALPPTKPCENCDNGTAYSLPGYTFNPWWGCLKVSAECKNCYAETFAHRYGHEVWGPASTTQRRFFGDKHWLEPVKWNYEAEKSGIRRKVFCASMADVFEDNYQVEIERLRLFNLIKATPYLDWLLLTKRPENIMKMVPGTWHLFKQPIPNLWLGTSVGVNDTMNRIDELRQCRHLAQVLFLSCEPLLENVSLSGKLQGIDWVIVGGESGSGKRPFEPDWARTIREDCRNAGVAFFMKQIDKVKEIPSDLMIRELPKA